MLFENLDRIVFAGDSVTDMGSAQPVGEGLFESLGSGYVRHIENHLSAVYPELSLRVTNAGISGNTSRDLRARFARDVLDLHPQWISICIGINDVWRQFDCPAMPDAACTPDAYRDNLTDMITRAKALPGVKGVFLLSPYYIEPNTADFMRARMDEYVAICHALATAHDCIFVDFQAMFAYYCRIRHSSYLAWDRVHPNQVGAELMARAFLKAADFDFNHTPRLAR